MSICLSYASADRALEALAHQNVRLEPASSHLVHEFTATEDAIAEVSDVLQNLLGEAARDLDLLVGDQRLFHSHGQYTVHRWMGTIPEGSIARIDDGLYVSMPAFCLLQQANELHMINLCQMLGRYLALASSPDLRKNTKPERRRSLVSEEELVHFLSLVRYAKGRSALYEALRWTAGGAASFQETDLQLALCLPYAYGGFGLNKPDMNHEVEFEGLARRIRGEEHEKCYVDLYWEGKKGKPCGLEFQGRQHEAQIGDDYARYYALDASGVTIWPVASEQLHDAVQMMYVAQKVARHIGKKLSPNYWPKEEMVQRLLDILAGKAYPKVGERYRHRRAA